MFVGKGPVLPVSAILHVLSFSRTYYKDGALKNRGGKFVSQIKDDRKSAISEKLRPVIRVPNSDWLNGKRIIYYTYERHIGKIHRLCVDDHNYAGSVLLEFTTVREVARKHVPDRHFIP